MGSIDEVIKQMKRNPHNVGFDDICRVCEYYFGAARRKGSHVIYKTPWQGDPRINIQDDKGKAKVYQVRQVPRALERLEVEHGGGN
ncbi:MAG: toxin HicA [Chloroflexota bacterium]|nr:toxin HicA [Chloroflexota bacterium]